MPALCIECPREEVEGVNKDEGVNEGGGEDEGADTGAGAGASVGAGEGAGAPSAVFDSEVLFQSTGGAGDKVEVPSSIPIETSVENQVLWKRVLTPPMKQMIAKLLDKQLLRWEDLLEDGNLFWEIGFAEQPGQRDQERWHEIVINFLMVLAWDKSIEKVERLYPTRRLQLVRSVFLKELAERPQQKLDARDAASSFDDGSTLPGTGQKTEAKQKKRLPAAGASRAAPAAAERDVDPMVPMSEYEIKRARNIASNLKMLVALGLEQTVAPKPKKPAAAARAKTSSRSTGDAAATATAAPARASHQLYFIFHLLQYFILIRCTFYAIRHTAFAIHIIRHTSYVILHT